MDNIATASINSFGISPKVDFVSPSEEPVFILATSQLQDLITQAVKKAIQPLQDEVTQLREEHDKDREDMAAMHLKFASLETRQEEEISRVCVDIAYDRQRLAKLEKGTPGQTDEKRIEKLQGYLKDKKSAGLRPEASFTEARTYLEVSRSQFSQLISKLDPRDFVISPNPLNYKSKTIGLSHRM